MRKATRKMDAYQQFTATVKANGWSLVELRCEVPPSDALLAAMDEVGLETWERCVIRYEREATNQLASRYEIRNDLYNEIASSGLRKPVVRYTVWDRHTGEQIGVRFETLRQVKQFLRAFLAGETK